MVNVNIISLVAVSALFSLVSSAPLQTRQIGSLTCNINRLKIVGAIAQSKSNLKTIASASTDPTTLAAVANAQAALTMASGGIANIAKSIITLQKASPTDRDTVQSGITQAISVVAGIDTTTDTAAAAGVASAQASLEKSATAGDGVVSTCK